MSFFEFRCLEFGGLHFNMIYHLHFWKIVVIDHFYLSIIYSGS